MCYTESTLMTVECMYKLRIFCIHKRTSRTIFSGGSRNPRTVVHRHGAVEYLGSGDCFGVPSQISFGFILRVENIIHTVKMACQLQLTYIREMQSKCTKTFQQGGVRPVLRSE